MAARPATALRIFSRILIAPVLTFFCFLWLAGCAAPGLFGGGPDALVSDVVYVPLETPLILAAKARVNLTVSGLGMLLNQAGPCFKPTLECSQTQRRSCSEWLRKRFNSSFYAIYLEAASARINWPTSLKFKISGYTRLSLLD